MLAGLKKPDEAIRLIDEIIKGADAGARTTQPQTRLLARSATRPWARPNARPAGPPKPPSSFLRVDQLYAAEPEAHAESLANLAELLDPAAHDRACQPRR